MIRYHKLFPHYKKELTGFIIAIQQYSKKKMTKTAQETRRAKFNICQRETVTSVSALIITLHMFLLSDSY